MKNNDRAPASPNREQCPYGGSPLSALPQHVRRALYLRESGKLPDAKPLTMRQQVAERMTGFDQRQLYRDQDRTLTRVALRGGRVVDAQSRLAQFLVVRMCPHAPKGAAKALAQLGEHVVWVVPDPGSGLYGCDAKRYRVSDEDRSAAEIRLGQNRTGAYVCEHMGHLIE